MNKPDHITTEAWEAMSPRERRKAGRPPEAPKPEKTEAQKAATAFNLKLMNAGGNLWTKGGKKRIYFNGVNIGLDYVDVYYDCNAEEWSDNEIGEAVIQKINSGIKF